MYLLDSPLRSLIIKVSSAASTGIGSNPNRKMPVTKRRKTRSNNDAQRSFLKSFVEKIEADDEKVKMYYTIPVPSDSIVQETTGVLPFVHHG